MAAYIGVAIFIGLMIWGYQQIPPEPAENVEARKRYGKAGGLDVEVLELTHTVGTTETE